MKAISTNTDNWIRRSAALIFSFFFGVVICAAQGQQQPILAYGDKVPDISLTLYNGDSVSHRQLSDFSGRLVLFVFWNTHCPSCIAAMPGLWTLQQSFGDQIKIIIVAPPSDSPVVVKDFWTKLKGHATPKLLDAGKRLPMVEGDSVIYNLFDPPYPTHVWIDGNGIYRRITEEVSMSAENIRAFLDHRPDTLMDARRIPLKKYKPLSWMHYLWGTGLEPEAYSFLLHRINGPAGMGTGWDLMEDSLTHKVKGAFFYNAGIMEMYRQLMAWESGRNYYSIPRDTICLEVSDSSRYICPESDEGNEMKAQDWYNQHTFCFADKEATVEGDIYDRLFRSLDRTFGLTSRVEERQVRYLGLRKLSAKGLSISKAAHFNENITVTASNRYQRMITGARLWMIASNLQADLGSMDGCQMLEVKDETGFAGVIDLNLPVGVYGTKVTYNDVLLALHAAGLDLVEEYQTKKVMVLHEQGYEAPKDVK